MDTALLTQMTNDQAPMTNDQTSTKSQMRKNEKSSSFATLAFRILNLFGQWCLVIDHSAQRLVVPRKLRTVDERPIQILHRLLLVAVFAVLETGDKVLRFVVRWPPRED